MIIPCLDHLDRPEVDAMTSMVEEGEEGSGEEADRGERGGAVEGDRLVRLGVRRRRGRCHWTNDMWKTLTGISGHRNSQELALWRRK